MKISGGLSEEGVVVGNTFDKYGSRNPVVRKIMRGFHSSLDELVDHVSPKSIHEVGCGEGYWVLRWANQGLNSRGSDFSDKVVELARCNAQEQGLSDDIFVQKSVYDLDENVDSADLVVCCEVMEHLEFPEQALRVLSNIAQRYLILSVPREPLWSSLNMARGKYWADFGNTPGHIQRWSKKSFTQLVSDYFEIRQTRSPIPWTMLLCSPKN